MKPAFSIIIPVFKTDKNFLEKNLNSVAKQTFKDFELIVINDGSGESYFDLDDLLNSIFLNDKRVKLINHKTNLGLATARNTGMNFASGKYILHMDSDDYWLCENTLNYLYRIMECDGCEILRFNGKYDINGKTHPSIFPHLDCVNVSCSTTPGLRAYRSIFLFLFKRSFLTRTKIQFDTTIGVGEDAYFISKALSKSKKVSSISKGLYAYRLHTNSMMRVKWTLADFKSDEKAFFSVIKHFAKDQPSFKDYAKYIMWVYNLSVNKDYPITRDALCKNLKEKNIDTRPCFTPINYQDHLINKYKRFKKEDCPNANALMQNGFYLPSGNLISDSDIDFVCDEIINLTKK